MTSNRKLRSLCTQSSGEGISADRLGRRKTWKQKEDGVDQKGQKSSSETKGGPPVKTRVQILILSLNGGGER